MTVGQLINELCALDWHDHELEVVADGKLVAGLKRTDDRVFLELVDREDVAG